MSARVILETAGSHVFDVSHIRREGGKELVELLLHQAGYDQPLTWRLQVQKKLMCNSETPPIRVVDEPKKWAVYLKIKPGDNNSCHYCSLLMPPGFQGEVVSQALKRVENNLDRNWKHQARERARTAQPVRAAASVLALPANGTVAAAAVLESPPPAAPSEQPLPEPDHPELQGATMNVTEEAPKVTEPPTPQPVEKTDSRGWLSDREKLRLILLAIHEIDCRGDGAVRDQGHFAELFCEKLGWQGLNRFEIGGILTSLVRKNYIIRMLRGSKPAGYQLMDDGYLLIKDLVDPAVLPPPAAPASAPVAAVDPANIILSLARLAQQFASAKEELEQIAIRENELTTELNTLRQKKTEICKLLDNQEVQHAMAHLVQLQRGGKL